MVDCPSKLVTPDSNRAAMTDSLYFIGSSSFSDRYAKSPSVRWFLAAGFWISRESESLMLVLTLLCLENAGCSRYNNCGLL